MTTVTIEDSTYQKLRALAAARGLSLDALLNAIAGLNAPVEPDSTRQLAALESFSNGMKASINSHLPPGHIADDSRESVYEHRGE
ncbi:MAG: hypothetical protein JWP03_1351 [Phycisphaerales bacterium]|nr:hypothetical protein [Phycisphaerales bacterium]MDB5357209.1 hypothetical protein [Phycisphaerales bacterium]